MIRQPHWGLRYRRTSVAAQGQLLESRMLIPPQCVGKLCPSPARVAAPGLTPGRAPSAAAAVAPRPPRPGAACAAMALPLPTLDDSPGISRIYSLAERAAGRDPRAHLGGSELGGPDPVVCPSPARGMIVEQREAVDQCASDLKAAEGACRFVAAWGMAWENSPTATRGQQTRPVLAGDSPAPRIDEETCFPIASMVLSDLVR